MHTPTVVCPSMATHEPELTRPVDLCTPDGKHLNPAAGGWSRTPLHRANLRGWGRTKRWDYWGILLGNGYVSVTFADLDYAGMAALEWADFETGETGGTSQLLPLGRGIDLPDIPGSTPLRLHSRRLSASVTQGEGGTNITADWRTRGGGRDSLEVFAALPAGHESLNVVVPWSATRFQFTSKHQARPATGTLRVGGQVRPIGTDTLAWATLDVGRGRWPYRALWNWAGGAGTTCEGHTVGLQLGSKWTDGTGMTENGIILDGRLTKIGEELIWDYRIDRPLGPWRVRNSEGTLELTLVPEVGS